MVAAMFALTPQERAYLAPFFAFIALFGVGEAVHHLFEGQAFWVFAETQYWVFPLQTVVSAFLLWHWRRLYDFHPPSRLSWTVAMGVLIFAIWVAPQVLLHRAPRFEGFIPDRFGLGLPYALQLALRLARAVIVVPLIEELFWRGFLLRYLVNPDFTKVPFGTMTRLSFTVVTVGFCLEHQMPDWPAALISGTLFNLVAFRTRSLLSCVLAHAVANLTLSAYVLWTRQWGFW